MSLATLATALLGQQHQPPAGAHIILLVGAVVAALVLFGVSRVRKTRNRPESGRERLLDEDRESDIDSSEEHDP